MQYEVKISNNITEKDEIKLRRFVKNANYLSSTSILKKGVNEISHKVSFVNGKPPEFIVHNLPNEEQICQLIMAFRFFYAAKETSYLPKILKIIGRCAEDDEIRPILKKLNQNWQNFIFKRAIQISINKKPITSERIINLWFNGFYFHQDEEKEKELEHLNSIMTEEYSKFLLVEAVYQGSKIIQTIGKPLSVFLKQS